MNTRSKRALVTWIGLLVLGTMAVASVTSPAYARSTWSGRIAGTSEGNSDWGAICTMKPDGTDVVGLTDGGFADAGPADGRPCWSPSQTKIAFWREPVGSSVWYVFTMSANGSSQTTETFSWPPGAWTSRYGPLAWSPSGRYITLLATSGGNNYIVAVDRTHHTSFVVKKVPSSSYPLGSMKFTPDGKRLLIVETDATHGWMRLIKFAPSSTVIKTYGFAVASADLSWDGSRIAYRPFASDQIMTCNAATGRTRNPVAGVHGGSPQWSRNDSMIAYEVGAVPSGVEIYIARPTSHGVRITPTIFSQDEPAW